MALWASLRKYSTLKHAQELLTRTAVEPLYIAIAFEGHNHIKSGFASDHPYGKHGKMGEYAEFGVSVLDTRHLINPNQDEPLKLATHNIVIGTDKYYEWAARRFLYGKPRRVQPSDFLGAINEHLHPQRDVILVGHSMSQYLKALGSLGIDINRLPLLGLIDTHMLAKELSWDRLCQASLMEVLHLPRSRARYHNAGNDANFTMKIMIRLAILDFQKAIEADKVSSPSEDTLRRVKALLKMVMAPLPGIRSSEALLPKMMGKTKVILRELLGTNYETFMKSYREEAVKTWPGPTQRS